MNLLKTNLLKFNKDEKSSFSREKYREVVKTHTEMMKMRRIVTDQIEARKEEWAKRSEMEHKAALRVVADHLEECKDAVGEWKDFAKIVEPNEGQIRAWRKGTKMKATTAMKFEAAFNVAMVERGIDFRCDRMNLLAWFFVSGVTK